MILGAAGKSKGDPGDPNQPGGQLARPPAMADVATGQPAAPSALEISGVSHRFGKVEALKGVSFSVPKGRFSALLGVNGAGKTTLFSLITRLYDNSSGRIRVGGYDVRRQPGEALARLGVVFQSRSLDGDLTLQQNLSYHAALHGLGRRIARERISEVVGMVGLEDRLTARLSALSGGQQRRAEIARALLHRPELLLLDEATAGLDLRARGEILALLRSFVADLDVSVLLATHIFDELMAEDQIVILHQGRVLADSTVQQMTENRSLDSAFLSLTGVPL